MRLYGADPAIIKALAGTGIGIVIGAGNGDIPSLAADPNAASQWINSNVLPFYPASKIILITIGNEVRSTLIYKKINLILQNLNRLSYKKKKSSDPVNRFVAGADVGGSESSEPATPGDAKRPKSTRGDVARRENQGVDGALDDGAWQLGPAIFRFVCARFSSRFKGDSTVPKRHWFAFHY